VTAVLSRWGFDRLYFRFCLLHEAAYYGTATLHAFIIIMLPNQAIASTPPCMLWEAEGLGCLLASPCWQALPTAG
jgi:hypothetical protein